MKPILFLVDEDCESVLLRNALERCGHAYRKATDALSKSAHDREVRSYAADIGATLITRNKRHFVRALARQATRQPGTCPVLFIRCTHAEAAKRFPELDPLIRKEHELCSELPDDRAIVELFDSRITFVR